MDFRRRHREPTAPRLPVTPHGGDFPSWSSGSAAEDRIATTAASFESEVLALATSAASRIDAAAAHVARFVIPIEQVARAALDAERRRLRDARDDLLRFSTLIQS